jgi:hypothetical protein
MTCSVGQVPIIRKAALQLALSFERHLPIFLLQATDAHPKMSLICQLTYWSCDLRH